MRGNEGFRLNYENYIQQVEKIQHKDFSGRAKDKNLCANCDMRHYCRRKGDC